MSSPQPAYCDHCSWRGRTISIVGPCPQCGAWGRLHWEPQKVEESDVPQSHRRDDLGLAPTLGAGDPGAGGVPGPEPGPGVVAPRSLAPVEDGPSADPNYDGGLGSINPKRGDWWDDE